MAVPGNQIVELKKKQENQAQLLRHKQRSDEAAKRLQDEIVRMKTQKVSVFFASAPLSPNSGYYFFAGCSFSLDMYGVVWRLHLVISSGSNPAEDEVRV